MDEQIAGLGEAQLQEFRFLWGVYIDKGQTKEEAKINALIEVKTCE